MDVRATIVTMSVFVALLALPATAVSARPCSLIGDFKCMEGPECVNQVKKSAEWVIEAKITSIKKTGTQQECEEAFASPYGGQICSTIDKPEEIHVSFLRVL